MSPRAIAVGLLWLLLVEVSTGLRGGLVSVMGIDRSSEAHREVESASSSWVVLCKGRSRSADGCESRVIGAVVDC